MPYTLAPFTPQQRSALWAPLALALALAHAPAQAERADRDKPMNIEADALVYEEQQQQSTFTGNVLVTKGSITMRGAKLVVRQNAQGQQFATLSAAPGARAFVRQKREGLNEFVEGEAETIEYNSQTHLVRLLRRAEMRRVGPDKQVLDQVLGSVITYNDVSEAYTVDGASASAGAPSAAPSGRVRAILSPRGGSGNAPAPAPAPLRPASSLQGAGGQP